MPLTNAPANSVLPRANVLGIGVHAVNMSSTLVALGTALANRSKGYVCVTGVHGVMEARRDPALRAILKRALLVVPDGMPTVWMGRLQNNPQMRRAFGPDLMLAVMGDARLQNYSHFLYGGDIGVAEQLKHNLQSRFPGASIVGTFTPPFRPLTSEESCDLRERIARLRPDIVWVGLSTPKQEVFMAEFLSRLDATLMIGVGAAFDFHTGRLKDSPQWVKQAGLQWAHRLLQEPRRLWKRYLLNNPLFLVLAVLQLTGLRRFPLDSVNDSPSLPNPPNAQTQLR